MWSLENFPKCNPRNLPKNLWSTIGTIEKFRHIIEVVSKIEELEFLGGNNR